MSTSKIHSPNDILLSKTLSYTKLILSFTTHLILSIIIGPLIAVFLYMFFLIMLQIDPSTAGSVNQDKLIGYWFLLIIILVFGLVWLGYFNNRKSDLLASQKCQRWYYEYWNILHGNVQDPKNIPALPQEGAIHYEVRTIAMDKHLPRILGLLIVVVMAPIMAVFSFYSPSLISRIDPNLNVKNTEKYIGTVFWLLVLIVAIGILIYLVRRGLFKPNIEHVAWRQFWINLVLVTLMNDKLYSSMKGYEVNQVANVTKSFSDKYKTIYDQMTVVLANQNNTLNSDQLDWLENMITYLETTPGFLIPPSISTISKFYTYALLITGIFSSVLLEPAKFVLTSIAKLFLG